MQITCTKGCVRQMEYFGRLSWPGFHTLLREGLSVPWLKGRFDQRYQASANCIPKARRTPITESGSTLCVLGTTCPSNTDPPSRTLRIRKPGGKGVRIHTSLAVIVDTEGALDMCTLWIGTPLWLETRICHLQIQRRVIRSYLRCQCAAVCSLLKPSTLIPCHFRELSMSQIIIF